MASVDEIVIDDSELVNNTIKELEAQLQKEPEPVSSTLDNVIVVDCIPIVGPDKVDRLKNVIKRTFLAHGNVEIRDYSCIHMPMGENNKSFG